MEGKRSHYGWLVCASLAVMQLSLIVVTVNAASLFALPMSQALGATRTEWMLWTTFYSAACLIATPVWGNLLQDERIPIRLLMSIGVCCIVVALLLFAYCSSLWMAYLAGLFCGISIPGVRNVAMPVFATNWFSDKRRGIALGILNSSNGLGGMILSPLMAMIVSSYGCRAGYLTCAALVVITSAPFALFIASRKPADKGLLPIGFDPNDPEEKKSREIEMLRGDGVPLKRAMKTVVFYLLALSVITLACTNGFRKNMALIAGEFLLNTEYAADAMIIGGICLSLCNFSDMSGDILVGWLADRISPFKVTFAFLLLNVLMFVSWIFFGHTPLGLCFGALCSGFQGSLLDTTYPLICRQIFGAMDFSKIWSRCLMWKAFIGGFSATIVSFFYDAGGGYVLAMWFGMAMVAISAACIIYSYFHSKRHPYKWDKGSIAVAE